MVSEATIAAAVSAGMQTEYGETVLEADMDKLGAGLAPGIKIVETSAVEDWREVGADGEPDFENSWVNVVSGFNTAAFYLDPFGVVHLKGLIKDGTVGNTAFTMPAGYRPSAVTVFPAISNSTFGRLDISSGGAVTPTTPSSNTWVSLDGMTFRAV